MVRGDGLAAGACLCEEVARAKAVGGAVFIVGDVFCRDGEDCEGSSEHGLGGEQIDSNVGECGWPVLAFRQ